MPLSCRCVPHVHGEVELQGITIPSPTHIVAGCIPLTPCTLHPPTLHQLRGGSGKVVEGIAISPLPHRTAGNIPLPLLPHHALPSVTKRVRRGGPGCHHSRHGRQDHR